MTTLLAMTLVPHRNANIEAPRYGFLAALTFTPVNTHAYVIKASAGMERHLYKRFTRVVYS